MDNFLLHAITRELAEQLTGQWLERLAQSGTTDLTLEFSGRTARHLAIAAAPQRLAVYLTRQKPSIAGARRDTPFVALAQKYLRGARLTNIEKLGYDRVITLHFAAANETGEPVARELAIALLGRAANVYLLENGQTLAALRELPTPAQTESAAPPQYCEPLPPATAYDPFSIAATTLEELIVQANGDLAQAAREHLLGFNSVYAEELARRAQDAPAHLALQELLTELFDRAPQPRLYTSAPLVEWQAQRGAENNLAIIAPIVLQAQTQLHTTPFPTVNEAAATAYATLAQQRAFIALQHELHVQLNARLKKQRQLQTNLTRERDQYARGEQYQRFGELLLANATQAEKHGDQFRVTDFYDDALTPINIPASGKATVHEAAEHYFKQARKARHGLQTLSERLPAVESACAALEAQLTRLRQITTDAQLAELANSVGLKSARQPAIGTPKTANHKTGKAAKLPGVRRYRSSEGYEILVGRTNRDNDNLTLRIAKSYDWWFHAADYPGSHVIVRNPQRQPPPPQTITEAAQLAAKFSQARTTARLAVNYCERKYVTKPKGFAPGQVRLSTFKTILVEPREAGERILD